MNDTDDMMAPVRLQMLLWLLAAFTLTKQDMVSLHVSPTVTAKCGEAVTLHCNVSTSQKGLSIKKLEWFEDNRPLCKLSDEKNLTHFTDAGRKFHCEYKEGQLSLILHEVSPLDGNDSKRFMCKLRSNQGISHNRSRIRLQECCGSVEEGTDSHGPVCKFHGVYPDADVLWFDGSRGPLKQTVYKNVEEGGWITIISELNESSYVSPNCSLRSNISRGPITCMEFLPLQIHTRFNLDEPSIPERTTDRKNGNAPLGPFGVVLYIALSISATL